MYIQKQAGDSPFSVEHGKDGVEPGPPRCRLPLLPRPSPPSMAPGGPWARRPPCCFGGAGGCCNDDGSHAALLAARLAARSGGGSCSGVRVARRPPCYSSGGACSASCGGGRVTRRKERVVGVRAAWIRRGGEHLISGATHLVWRSCHHGMPRWQYRPLKQPQGALCPVCVLLGCLIPGLIGWGVMYPTIETSGGYVDFFQRARE
jgi:hypothetical protein